QGVGPRDAPGPAVTATTAGAAVLHGSVVAVATATPEDAPSTIRHAVLQGSDAAARVARTLARVPA
ncbi:MAG: hypothetical protein ACHP7K_11705, partial [Actinomycetales bacterium]